MYVILYNMRERGPYEYDKFVLNILQLYNSINLVELTELQNVEENINTLNILHEKINNYYNSILNISEKLNTEYLKYREDF